MLGAGAFWAASASRLNASVGETTNGGTIHTGTTISGVYDVSSSPYNAKGDGVTNDAPAIQAAINAASASDGYGDGGGIVYLPAGNYYLGAPLTITQQIVMLGAGWGNPYPNDGGTMLIVPNISAMTGSAAAITISGLGRGTTLRDLSIYHAQTYPSSGWTPVNFPPAISITASDVLLDNLLLVNPTIGISLTTGRVSMNRIHGQPLTTGIFIDNAEDVVRMNNMHFWPFWNNSSYVSTWQYNNAVAIKSARNDSPQMSNLFAINYNKMFYFTSSSDGITTTCFVTNANSDGCYYGMYVDANAVTGTFSNCGFNACHVQADNVALQFSNLHLAESNGPLMYVGSNSTSGSDMNFVSITNLLAQDWNITTPAGGPTAAACITSHNLSTVYVGGGAIFRSGNLPTPNQSPTLYYAAVSGGIINEGS